MNYRFKNKKVMETKIEQIRNKLAEVYFQKTGEAPSNNSLSLLDFYEKIREDVSNYLVDTLDINADELIFTYFFDTKDIKELIKLYFEVTNIKIKDLKKLQKANIRFTLKHMGVTPYFAGNVFCKIADELAFYISRYVD
jgi:hypothetical protein